MARVFLMCVIIARSLATSMERLGDTLLVQGVDAIRHGHMRGTVSHKLAAAAGASSTKVEASRTNHKGEHCGLMLLTFFSTRSSAPAFDDISELYRTAMEQGVNVTVLYDDLPVDILMTANTQFQFMQVLPEDFKSLHGESDVRYNLVDSLIRRHPEWRYVFLVDPFETQVTRNPCLDVSDDQLYTAIEPNPVRLYAAKDSALSTQFHEMGGKYQEWWHEAAPNGKWKTFSDGIIGGHRDVMLTFTEEMLRVLTDLDVTERKRRTEVNINTAAFNYLMEVVLKPKVAVKTGRPVHYCYWGFEVDRKLGPPEHECYMSERVGGHKHFWFAHK